MSAICFLGTIRVWTGAWGLMSSKATVFASSWAIFAGTFFSMILQKRQFGSSFTFFFFLVSGKAPEETGSCSGVASRPGLIDLNEERVQIAIVQNVLHPLHMARSLAFLPEFFARTAPEPSEAGLNGSAQRLRIHIG